MEAHLADLRINPSPQHKSETSRPPLRPQEFHAVSCSPACFGARIVRRRQALRKAGFGCGQNSQPATKALSLVGVSGPNHLHDSLLCGGGGTAGLLKNRSIPTTENNG